MQLVVIVSVVKAGSDRQRPLSHKLFGIVFNPGRISRIMDGIGHGASQAKAVVALSQDQ